MSRVLHTLYGHDRDIAHWVAERIPHLRPRLQHFEHGMVFGPCAAIGVVDDLGALIAGVVFHGYDPFTGNIEVSCASDTPRWGNREIFREILRYPFSQLSCTRCTAVTPRRAPPGATSPRKFLEGLGFVREGSVRRGFGSENAIIYGLLAEEWATGRFCAPRRRNGDLGDGKVHATASACA